MPETLSQRFNAVQLREGEKMRGDGSVLQRGNRWWFSFYRDGKRVSKSCGRHCKSEDQAKTKLRAEMRKTDDEFVEPRVKRTSISDLMDNLFLHYKSEGLSDYQKMAEAKWKAYLKPAFEHVKAHMFSTTHQMQYRTKRLEAGAENATVNREFQILRRAFTLGFNHEPSLVKRVPRFKITDESANIRKGFITITQLDALRVAASKEGLEFRAVLELGVVLGWRKGELLKKLTVGHVHLADSCIRLEPNETKNKEGREVPLSDPLRVLLTPLVVGRKSEEQLFRVVKYDFRRAWARITKAAGCPGSLFHDLRRTSARAKRSAGVDSSIIMSVQGWKTDSVFRRYAIVATSDKLDAFAKQEQYEAQARIREQQQFGHNPAQMTNGSEVAASKPLSN